MYISVLCKYHMNEHNISGYAQLFVMFLHTYMLSCFSFRFAGSAASHSPHAKSTIYTFYRYAFNAVITASYSASDSVFLLGSMANVLPHSNASSLYLGTR